MLDLNNVTLSSLLTLNIDDSAEVEPLALFKEDSKQEDENSVDPGAFVLLFAQVMDNKPELEQQVTLESVNLTETKPVSNETLSDNSGLDNLDDNIAVAWINSEYCQSEIDSDLISANQQSLELIDDAMEATQVELDMGQDVDVLNNVANGKKSALLAQTTPTHGADLIQQKSDKEHFIKIAQDAAHDMLQNSEAPLKDESNRTAINTILKLDNRTQNNTDLNANSVEITESHFALEEKLGDDKRLNAAEDVLHFDAEIAEAHTRSKTSVMPEQAIRASDVSDTKNIHQTVLDNTTLNQVSNNIQNPFIERHEIDGPSLIMSQPFVIPAEISNPEWSTQFSEHIMFLGQQGIKSAVIKLHPEELGPLEISIKVVNNSASINISSHNQEVRQMIDQSLPKLQEMMAEQGLNLSDVNIDSNTKERQFDQQHQPVIDDNILPVDDEDVSTSVKSKKVSQGVIDYFA